MSLLASPSSKQGFCRSSYATSSSSSCRPRVSTFMACWICGERTSCWACRRPCLSSRAINHTSNTKHKYITTKKGGTTKGIPPCYVIRGAGSTLTLATDWPELEPKYLLRSRSSIARVAQSRRHSQHPGFVMMQHSGFRCSHQ